VFRQCYGGTSEIMKTIIARDIISLRTETSTDLVDPDSKAMLDGMLELRASSESVLGSGGSWSPFSWSDCRQREQGMLASLDSGCQVGAAVGT
jgi:hypothetical protein